MWDLGSFGCQPFRLSHLCFDPHTFALICELWWLLESPVGIQSVETRSSPSSRLMCVTVATETPTEGVLSPGGDQPAEQLPAGDEAGGGQPRQPGLLLGGLHHHHLRAAAAAALQRLRRRAQGRLLVRRHDGGAAPSGLVRPQQQDAGAPRR